MSLRLVRSILLLATVAVLPAASSFADGERQYYSDWQKHPKANYYFTTYNYKPTANADDYQHHYVIWTPASPKYCYCYNPSTKSYYGRWDLSACGKEHCHLGNNPHGYYSIAKGQQKGTLAEIPETAFSGRSEAPRIPVDSGNPAPVAAPAVAGPGNGATPPPAAGGNPAAPPAGNPPPANPPAANPPTVNPTTPDAPPAAANTAPPAGGDAAPPAAAPQANNNPQVQPPPDLPDDALAAAGAGAGGN